MRSSRYIAPAIFLIFIYSTTIAQYRVRNYYSLAGRRESPVNCINQAYDGHLLLGGHDGLFIFDGKSSVNEGIKFRQLRQGISAVCSDVNEDATWSGTVGGKIYIIRGNKLDSAVLPGNTSKITAFYQSGKNMYVGTYGNGIYRVAGTSVTHYKDTCGLSDNTVYSIVGEDKAFWCCTDAGITMVNDKDIEPKFTIIGAAQGIPDLIVRNVSFDNGRLVVCMQDSGVCYYDLQKGATEKLPYFNGWSGGAVLNARMAGRERLVVATERSGIITFRNGVPSITDYSSTAMVTSVSQMFVDREKQVWIASKKGVSNFSEKRYFLVDSIAGLANQRILALAPGKANTMIAGTTTGITKIEKHPGGFDVSELDLRKQKTAVSCAATAPGGSVWFGTYGKGIMIVDPEVMGYNMLSTGGDSLAADNISNIHFANDSIAYVSTLGNGLFKLRIFRNGATRSFRVERNYNENDGLGSNYVYAAVTDNNGRLYAATDGGGLQVLKNNQFIMLISKFGLRSTTAFSVCRDKLNRIWATSSADGIVMFDGRSLKVFGQEQGLRDLEPQQIVVADNAIYSLHAKGIDRIDITTFDVTYFDVSEPGFEPNLNAVYAANGSLYCGTNKGVLVFRFDKNEADSIKPTVFLHSLQMNYQQIPLDSLTEYQHSQNNLSFGFGGIWLKNPEKLFFRYKLHGLEEKWNYADEGKIVNYNNLQPGLYTFMVQSKNEEDVWSEATGYSFVMLTPIWKRWWFWTIVVLVTAGAIILFVRYRLRILQRENQILEEKVQLRTREIAKQSRVIEKKNIELEQLSLVASKTDNVVLILDADGNLEYINESFMKLIGLTLEEVRSKYGSTIYDLSDHEDIREIIQDAVDNHKSVSYETLNKKVEHREIWGSSTLTPIFDDNDKLKKIIIIDTDVTERKLQEQIIVQKNKDITDSISYARKIQTAILPAQSLIKEHLPDSFVLYMTKDIVSGDFYWFCHMHDFSIIAAVDCTGHGVPGAFMSLIGYNLLNRIINENKIFDPSRILLELNNGVLGVLHKNESESKDGMDIAVCKINHHNKVLEYAGAMRPLWIVNGSELREVKADKIPIGTKQKDREETIAYHTQVIEVKPGDRFYIFTDGFADQFGGDRDKKFSTGKFKDLLLSNAALDFKTQEENIRKAHIQWKGDNEQVDDILVIGFTVS